MSNKAKNHLKTIILEDNLTDEESERKLIEITKTFCDWDKVVHCICTRCGDDGYAQDASMLDENGFLIDIRCPCGGRIRRIG